MKSFLMTVLMVSLLTVASAGQNVKLKVRAAIYDRDLNLKPVPHLVMKLISSATGAQPITLQTSFEGMTEADLPAGSYHLVTDSPVELFDKSYKWEFDVTFTKPENTLELSNDNAKATPLAGARDARKPHHGRPVALERRMGLFVNLDRLPMDILRTAQRKVY